MYRSVKFNTSFVAVALISVAIAIAAVAAPSDALAQPLPDLIVSDIQIDTQCRLSITVRNAGQGPVPASAYRSPGGATVAFYKNGASFGGWGLNAIDPQRKLTTPGASVTWLRAGHKIQGSMQIRVMADAHRNVVAESNENNNSLDKSFSCTPKLPDLRISQISFTQDCRARIRLENVGDDPAPDTLFRSEGAYVQRYLDGNLAGQIMFGPLDPAKAMQPPGGSLEWTDGSEYRASQSVKYALKRVGQEWSSANNVLEVAVPDNCRMAVQAPPDLVVGDVKLDQQCRIVVTLNNNGGPMPQSAYDPIGSPSINFMKDGKAFGGWSLNTFDPQKTLMTAGASVTWVRQQPTISGRAQIRIVLDPANELTEASEDNNSLTKNLNCGPSLPDLAIVRVTFDPQCRPSVQLRNAGEVSLPDKLYLSGGAYLQRIVDGRASGRIPLASIDAKRTLKPSGRAFTWKDTGRIRVQKTIKYQLAGTGEEERTDNNAVTASFPSRCRAGSTVPSIKQQIKRTPTRTPLEKR